MSNFYEDASVVMVPSGYKTSKVYSSVPDDGSADLTFSRSNDTATRVGPDGLIEKVRTNLFLQSNFFSNAAWIQTDITPTSGQSGYDGTNDAWELNVTASNGNLVQALSFSGVNTFSFYAKQGSLQYVFILFNGSGFNGTASVDLADGSIYNASVYLEDIKTTSVGGGWYRIEAVSNRANSDIRIYPTNNTSGGTTAAGAIYIQDAQLETGDVATDYIATTSSAVSVGPLANIPRLDYSGGATCPSLLLEPQRTNLALYSEQFDNAYWGKGAGVTLTANQYTSPDSYVSGDKLIGATGTDRNGDVIARIVSVSSSTTYVASIYVYKDTATQCTLYLRDGSTGTIVSTSVTLAAGWQRIECSITTGVATTQVNLYLGNTNGNIGIWGAQFEAGSYATSYIPTLSAAVTRGVDAASKTGISSLIGQTEGTLFFECSNKALLTNARYFSVSDGTGNNRIDIYQATATELGIYVGAGGVGQVNVANVTLPASGAFKFALAYANNDYVWYLNGVQIGTDTSASVPATSAALLGVSADLTPSAGNSPFKQALLFKTRLSNADLETLTTL